jgi:hypothetical protein
MADTQFVDVMSENADKVPKVSGTIIFLYATGSSYIEATAALIASFRAAGVGVGLLDQTQSLSVFAAGMADVADVENGAGTITEAIAAIKQREAHGWQSTIYISYDNLASAKAEIESAGCNMSLVFFGVANYNWSIDEAETLLSQNPDWFYVQYGDNVSNADTEVYGTKTTAGEASCDVDVGVPAFINQFLTKPPPPPRPAQVVPTKLSQTVYATVDMSCAPVAGYLSVEYNFEIWNEWKSARVWSASGAAFNYRGIGLPSAGKGATYFWRANVVLSGVAQPWSDWVEFTA